MYRKTMIYIAPAYLGECYIEGELYTTTLVHVEYTYALLTGIEAKEIVLSANTIPSSEHVEYDVKVTVTSES